MNELNTSEGSEAECLYELFHDYATWTHGDTVYSERPQTGVYAYNVEAGGVYPSGLRQMLWDLELLEGIPDDKINAYVREVMLRADQDRDGHLSISEFIVWFVTEVAALLPFKRNGMAAMSCAPLYNRIVYYMLVESATGVRRKASGLQTGQFMRMCRDSGITEHELMARNAIQTASTYASCARAANGLEAGTRLQLAQVVHALAVIAAKQKVSLEYLLYRIVSDGAEPIVIFQRPINATMQALNRKQVTRFMLESELEQPLGKTLYECDICGKTHERWINGDERLLKAYFQVAGMPYMPHFRIVNTRNVRSVFHKYNLKYNRGCAPPSSRPSDLDPEEVQGFDAVAADDDLDVQLQQAALRCSTCAEELKYDPPPSLSQWKVDGWPPRSSAASGPSARLLGRRACFCQVQSISLMELQTFTRLVCDNRTLRKDLKSISGNITIRRIEAAFTAASSMEGVYSKGPSIGVHDVPMTKPQAEQLRASAMATVSQPCRSPRTDSPTDEGRKTLPGDIPGSNVGSRASRAAASGSGVRPMSAVSSRGSTKHHWQGGVGGVPAPIIFSPPPPGSPQFEHRHPVPSLSFPQFLEALRLLAEDMVGHPQMLVSVELALWSIMHDVAILGCALPINQKWVRSVDGTKANT